MDYHDDDYDDDDEADDDPVHCSGPINNCCKSKESQSQEYIRNKDHLGAINIINHIQWQKLQSSANNHQIDCSYSLMMMIFDH